MSRTAWAGYNDDACSLGCASCGGDEYEDYDTRYSASYTTSEDTASCASESYDAAYAARVDALANGTAPRVCVQCGGATNNCCPEDARLYCGTACFDAFWTLQASKGIKMKGGKKSSGGSKKSVGSKKRSSSKKRGKSKSKQRGRSSSRSGRSRSSSRSSRSRGTSKSRGGSRSKSTKRGGSRSGRSKSGDRSSRSRSSKRSGSRSKSSKRSGSRSKSSKSSERGESRGDRIKRSVSRGASKLRGKSASGKKKKKSSKGDRKAKKDKKSKKKDKRDDRRDERRDDEEERRRQQQQVGGGARPLPPVPMRRVPSRVGHRASGRVYGRPYGGRGGNPYWWGARHFGYGYGLWWAWRFPWFATSFPLLRWYPWAAWTPQYVVVNQTVIEQYDAGAPVGAQYYQTTPEFGQTALPALPSFAERGIVLDGVKFDKPQLTQDEQAQVNAVAQRIDQELQILRAQHRALSARGFYPVPDMDAARFAWIKTQ